MIMMILFHFFSVSFFLHVRKTIDSSGGFSYDSDYDYDDYDDYDDDADYNISFFF
jgi:hypothetical protein